MSENFGSALKTLADLVTFNWLDMNEESKKRYVF